MSTVHPLLGCEQERRKQRKHFPLQIQQKESWYAISSSSSIHTFKVKLRHNSTCSSHPRFLFILSPLFFRDKFPLFSPIIKINQPHFHLPHNPAISNQPSFRHSKQTKHRSSCTTRQHHVFNHSPSLFLTKKKKTTLSFLLLHSLIDQIVPFQLFPPLQNSNSIIPHLSLSLSLSISNNFQNILILSLSLHIRIHTQSTPCLTPLPTHQFFQSKFQSFSLPITKNLVPLHLLHLGTFHYLPSCSSLHVTFLTLPSTPTSFFFQSSNLSHPPSPKKLVFLPLPHLGAFHHPPLHSSLSGFIFWGSVREGNVGCFRGWQG